MEKGIEIIKKLFVLIEKTKDINDLKMVVGTLQDSYDTISVYNSNWDIFSTISISWYENERLKRLNFAGEKFKISLEELKRFFGNYEYAYNYRDNYTGFFFLNIKSNNVKKIYCEKDNNFKKESDYFYEYTPKGKIGTNFTEDIIYFDNITFEMDSK